jgi:hypothetical protein
VREDFSMKDAGGLRSGPVLRGVTSDELSHQFSHLLRPDAPLGSLPFSLRITSCGSVGQHPLSFHPGLVRRDRPILSDGVLARISTITCRSVLDEEHLAASWGELEAETLEVLVPPDLILGVG